MATTVTVTFNSLPAVGTLIDLQDSLIVDPNNLKETFKLTRASVGDCVIGIDVNDMAFTYRKTLQIDYNSTNLYDIQFSGNVVTITANNPLSQFSLVTDTTGAAATIVINNDPVVTPLTIDTITVSQADTVPCDNVKISATLSEQADNITSPISQAVTTNPFVFDTVRADEIELTFDKGALIATEKVRIPQLLTVFFDVIVTTNPSGGVVNVNRLFPLSDAGENPLLLTFEYSIDNVIFQVSNSYSGLAEGNYTMYIKDNIGCSISIPFTVETFSANVIDFDPLVRISNANSFRFKINEVISNCGIRRNNNNSLSYEENTKINRRDFVQAFQKCDIIKTQIQSNYATNTAKICDCDGNETALTVIKATDNMNTTDIRDGKIKNLESGLLGIYFGSGKTYDPDTLLENGSYNLLENLMDWVNVGDYMNVEGLGWSVITNIIASDSEFPFYVAELAIGNTIGYVDGQTIKITTVYNVVDYDRFEFEVDMSLLQGYYQITVNSTDLNTGFVDREFVSEWINVQEEYKKHHLFEWYSNRNNEINYGTGIINKARIPYLINLKWSPNEEQEIFVTDTKTINLDSKVREFYELNLLPLPTAMAQKVVLILAHNRIKIDGETYLLEGEVESIPIGITNTYSIKANLVRSEYVFDNEQGLTSGEILLGSGIPLAIDSTANGLLFIE